MDADSTTAGFDELEAAGAASGLAALARISFGSLDLAEILTVATNGAATLAPCRVEASYRAIDGGMALCPPSQSEPAELTGILDRFDWNGQIELPNGVGGGRFRYVIGMLSRGAS